MMFKSQFLDGIRSGEITRTYRRWKKIQVKQGGTYQLMRGGAIEVTGIHAIDAQDISTGDAIKAGFKSAADMMTYVDKISTDGELYNILFKYSGEVKKCHPENNGLVNESEWQALDSKLKKKDGNSKTGPWTRGILTTIDRNPGMSSVEMAVLLKREQMGLKRDVRKLKALGLTVSLETGYKLTERGESFLKLSASFE
jgi:hypothetical protein